MTNEEKAKEIYVTVLVEVNGWKRADAERDFDETDSLYEQILRIIEE